MVSSGKLTVAGQLDCSYVTGTAVGCVMGIAVGCVMNIAVGVGGHGYSRTTAAHSFTVIK